MGSLGTGTQFRLQGCEVKGLPRDRSFWSSGDAGGLGLSQRVEGSGDLGILECFWRIFGVFRQGLWGLREASKAMFLGIALVISFQFSV